MSLLAHAAYQSGDVVAARKLTSELFEYVEQHNVRLNSLALRQNLGEIFEALALGNIDTAIETLEAVLTDAERLGQTSAICCSLINIGEVLVVRNEASRALPYLQRAYELTERSGEGRLHLDAKVALGAAEAASGSPMKGLRKLREMANERRHSPRLHVGDLCSLIEALLRAGLANEAIPYAAELEAAYAEHRAGVQHPMRVCLVLSDAAEARGDAVSAKRYRFEGATLAKAALERLPDEETRANFAAMPFNKRLLALNFGLP